METAEDLELFHYGVKGMKWGVTREDTDGDGRVDRKAEKAQKKADRRESSAKKIDARANKYRVKIKDIEDNPAATAIGRWNQKNWSEKYSKKEQQAIKDAAAKRSGKLTRNEKIAVVGAAVIATYAAYKVGSNYFQSGEANRAMMKAQAYMDGKEKPTFNKNSEFATKGWDADQLNKFVADGINEPGSFGGKVNCRRCTMTYEMRRRGYDVKATKTNTGRGQESTGLYNMLSKEGDKLVAPGIAGASRRMVSEMWETHKNPNAKAPYVDFATSLGDTGLGKVHIDTNATSDPALAGLSNSRKVFDALAKEPNGARGELGLTWAFGGGHSIAWEIVNNKPVIFDTQTGKYFKSSSEFYESYGKRMDKSGYTRLDNVDLNEDFLMRWMKNA